MLFQFAPAIQAAIDAGKYVQVFTSAGVPIGMARDPVTGQFVAHAVGFLLDDSSLYKSPVSALGNSPLSPLIGAAHLVTNAVQTHRGFQESYRRLDVIQAGLQSLQTSVGVLQATTAVIGVGVATGVALSAVNLYQTMKLKQAVERLEVKVNNGFINLEQVLKDQSAEIKQLIREVAQDIKFEQHRVILVHAYGLFIQALNCLRDAVKLQDVHRRNAQIDLAKGMLFEALADYDNPQLLEETCAAGLLRRRECAWAIDQAITMTYQLQGEHEVVSARLAHLQNQIRQDSLTVIERCETENELDFLFPEIRRIHDHDLAVLNSWQNHVDWMRTLSSEDSKLLINSDFNNPEFTVSPDTKEATTALAKPPEQLLYENLKQKSHLSSLHDQLLFMMKPDLRRESEFYISQQVAIAGYKTLVPSNLQQASDLAVANLYWYFKVRDESEEEVNETDDK
jgi:hypothetical protein